MHKDIKVTTPDGTFRTYVAVPAVTPAPVVVVIQEIFGVTAGIKEIADKLAGEGFLAVAPDLFWRLQPDLDLSEHSESDWQKALGFYKRFDIDTGVKDIAATLGAARKLPEATDKVGVMGFCLGGLLTFLTAARTKVDAAVEYYGGRTDEFVSEGANIKSPLLVHLAGEDEFIGKSAQETIHKVLGANPNIEIHTYPGRNHAFARPKGHHFDAKDAATANGRTAAFLKKHLA